MAEKQEQQREARERQRAVEVAFVTVFGEAGKRDANQQLVWDYLEHAGFRRRPMLYPSPAGTIDASQTTANAANHALFAAIERLVNAGALPMNPLNHPKPESVRE